MKKYILFFTAIALFIAALPGCKKDSISPSLVQAMVDDPDTLHANLVTCDSVIAATKYQSVNIISVKGIQHGGNTFEFTIPFGAVGTNEFNTYTNGVLCHVNYISPSQVNTLYSVTEGSVTISSNNGHRIEGSFNFIMDDLNHPDSRLIVTDGKMDVEYDVAF